MTIEVLIKNKGVIYINKVKKVVEPGIKSEFYIDTKSDNNIFLLVPFFLNDYSLESVIDHFKKIGNKELCIKIQNYLLNLNFNSFCPDAIFIDLNKIKLNYRIIGNLELSVNGSFQYRKKTEPYFGQNDICGTRIYLDNELTELPINPDDRLLITDSIENK